MSVRPSESYLCLEHISYIISYRNPHLICGYSLGSGIVTYYFRVTVTLTSGINSRKLSFEAFVSL